MRTSPRLRRARTLQAYWKDGDLVVENYLTRVAVSTAPITIDILAQFDDWTPRGAVAAALPQFSSASVARAVRALHEHTLLLEEGTDAAQADQAAVDTWQHWLPHASFHFATKDAPFASPAQWARMAKAFRKMGPQPPLVKRYPDLPAVALPAPSGPSADFLQVQLARQTHRDYTGAAVPLDRLATLLHYTWGAMSMIDSPNFGPLIHRTSPSGGARHPAEVYVAAFDVEGLAPGVYHYNHVDHTLEQMLKGDVRKKVLKMALGQEHVGTASAVFFMTAVMPRTMYKYRSPRAYRIVSLETGHLAQTFCLNATWLGLAPFTTAALADTAIERFLGLDGIEETVLYLVGVGMPISGATPGAAARPSASGRPTSSTRP